jgi:DNA-directed RNA polymerase specialized sigma24 family protein
VGEKLYVKFEDKTIEELIVLVRGKNSKSSEAFVEIVRRYTSRIEYVAGSYYIFGHGREDIINECRIALFKATDCYDDSRGASFDTYSDKVIKNHLGMLIRRVSVLIESKNKVCDLDFALNVLSHDSKVCEEVCSREYLSYVRNYIVGLDSEEQALFDAVIGLVSYKELKDSGRCTGDVYYKASRLIARIRSAIIDRKKV